MNFIALISTVTAQDLERPIADAAELALLGVGVLFTLIVFTIFVFVLRIEMKRDAAAEKRAAEAPAQDQVRGADAE